ncbi:MAG: helix-turn-helix domain-containing protein [Lachnospiraceae bacterium]|nr:helix-turn-helix domain-containing protein [Lachnospiraceae bacterium]
MSDTSSRFFSNQGITQSTRFIHTPGDFALNNLLYVQEAGVLKSLRPHTSSREGLESILFITIRDGEGFVRVSGNEYTVKSGDCILLNCMNKYEHESSESKPWELSWVHFYGKTAVNLYDLFLKENKDSVIFTPTETEGYVKMIENLMALCNDKSTMSEIYANETLTEMFTEIISDVTALSSEPSDIDVAQARTYLNDNYASDKAIDEICEKLGAAKDVVEDAFVDSYGISMAEYQKIRRLNVAKEMLRFSIEPESKIAEECGIKDYNDFIKLFVDAEGMTPEVYRSKWAQWIK